MVEAFKKFLRNYANFNGRSTRADYWWVVLCLVIIEMAISFLGGFFTGLSGASEASGLSATYTILGIFCLAIVVPSIALMVRRLHDINKSGYYIFMGLIPIAGPIILLIYALTDSVNEGNNFGEIVQ